MSTDDEYQHSQDLDAKTRTLPVPRWSGRKTLSVTQACEIPCMLFNQRLISCSRLFSAGASLDSQTTDLQSVSELAGSTDGQNISIRMPRWKDVAVQKSPFGV